jgi:ribosome recycling factor
MVKPFDDATKDDIVKSLNKADFEMQVTIEGKSIMVKLG